MSLLPTQGPPPILSAQKIFRYRGPPLGTGASSRRHRDLLSAVRGLLSAAQRPPLGIGTSFNPLSTEDRTYQHRGPPLCTGASSRHRGLPQHRGVGPFGIVSLLPTQEPPPILSAQKTFRHRGPPLGTGASSRRHRGLLSAAQGPPLGGTGPPLSGTRASSRYRGLPQSPQHRGVGPFGTVSLLPLQGPPPILSAQNTFRHGGPPFGTGASSRRHRGLLSAVRGLLSAAQGPLLGIGASLNPLSIEE